MQEQNDIDDTGPVVRVDNSIHPCPYCGETLMGPPMEYVCPEQHKNATH